MEHIEKYYETKRVDYAINTHPDQDHASGLTEVLKNLEVRELWMHRPWEYIEEIVKFVDKNSNFKGDKRAL
ncbi:MBL fold metallo-hydrolase [Helicobacter pylori]|nr:MBL fold metallo-hydrolase [Helicobacter pylori]